MSSIRKLALQEVYNRTPKTPEYNGKLSELYGKNVFHKSVMREYLTEEAFESVMAAIDNGATIDRRVADQVASAMKDWALSKGATHYTHWFQPLTGSTAEKHDAFFHPLEAGKAIERFSGDLLIQQEPDASSFPNGGIRNTFEARGYTAWDPSSPAFIISKTLCIPTIFIAYTGEALDYKMPFLKSLTAIEQAALYNARPDIMMTGRALFGHAPAKGQQLDDHYFGSIPDRVSAFMKEFEMEALKLGIPVTTRHNEVAPNQFECAPMFEEANLANDHNLLLMDVLEKFARKHDFRLLLHEKPFKGLNGSGKHNNWAMATDTGVNLFKPGKNPRSNMQFLTFLVNTVAAIHENADLLRASIAAESNDHRLGANEAPPAIISVFLGSYLTQVLDDLEKSVKAGKMTPEDKTDLKLNIGKIPQILLDNTDRNRTSPFAFTGNKFEFRAVGSSANCASALLVLNSIVAKQLRDFKVAVDARIDKGDSKDEAIFKELQVLIKKSKSIRFEGNGYGQEWVEEAARRGLSNMKDTPRALKVITEKKTLELFKELNIFSEVELHARQEIQYEAYVMKVQIEGRVMGDLAQNHLIPAVVSYQNRLIENVKGMMDVMGEKEAKELCKTQITLIREISKHLNQLKDLTDKMLAERKAANNIEDMEERALAYCDKVKPYFADIRYHADKLELLVDDELWPLPKMRELLFTK
jgi:glutamine synthetase